MAPPGTTDRRRAEATAPSFGRLAGRISSWTSRLLVSAILIVAALAFGRQIVLWWREDGGATAFHPSSLPAPPGLGDPTQLHEVVFGDQCWTMQRVEVRGAETEAAEALRGLCGQLTEAAPGPAGPGNRAEAELLAKLDGRAPAAGVPGRWEVHQDDEGLPMVVGVKNLAEDGLRVVTWGIAVPSGPESWTLYAFQPEQTRREPSSPGLPVPPGAEHVLSLRVPGGGGVTTFRGDVEDAAEWTRFYDRWSAGQGRGPVVWRQSGEARVGALAAAPDGASGPASLWFGPDPRGGCSGLLLVGPAEE